MRRSTFATIFPAHKLVRLASRLGAAIALFVGAVLLSLALTRPPSPLAASDRLFEGVAFRFFAPNRPPSDQIVIIAITEDTLAQLPYRSPIDRKFLADLVAGLAARQARVIGLDIVFDRPTEPAKDALLEETIARSSSPVVVASVGAETPLGDEPHRYLQAFLAGRRHGEANLSRDVYDNVVRNYVPVGSTGTPSLAAAVAEAVGAAPPLHPFRIMWRRTESGQPFSIYPGHLIDVLPPEWLRGKIALIGTMLPGQDEHRAPIAIFAHPLYGVQVHAHALSQILEGRAVAERDWLGMASVAGAAALGVAMGASSGGVMLIAGLVLLGLMVWGGAIAVFALAGPLVLPLAPTLSLGLGAGGARFWIARRERRDRQVLRQLFSRFVSEPVARELWKERETFLKGGRPRPLELMATVLFSDIAGFTPLCETMPPEPLYQWLDQYIDTMVEVVTAHDGIVLRFIGDGILAVFGVPIARRNDAEVDADARNAVRAAIAMVATLRSRNAQWQSEGMPAATIRVGIYTGSLLAGSLGSGSHMEYILQGDTVNTAARLEALGKNYLRAGDECVILVGDATRQRLNGLFNLESVGETKLKGKEQSVTIYRVLAS